MANEPESFEVLIIHQGFENRIYNFKMNDFKEDRLPNFDEPYNLRFKSFYRIERRHQSDRCPWGYSRWITGENGKLKMLDSYYDSSG